MEVNSEQSLWIILSITHLAPVLISSMVLWPMQATRRWVGVAGGGGGPAGRRRHLSGSPSSVPRAPRRDARPVGGGTERARGGFGARWGEPGILPHTPQPRAGSAARLPAGSAPSPVLPTGDFSPESKVSGKARLRPPRRDGEEEGARSAPRSRSAPGDSATPTPRRARQPLSPARSAHAPLLVNY